MTIKKLENNFCAEVKIQIDFTFDLTFEWSKKQKN